MSCYLLKEIILMNSKSFCAFLCASLFFILLAAMCLDGGNLLRISFIVHVTVGLMMLTYLVGKKQKNNQKNNEEDNKEGIKIHILYSSHVGSGIPARLLALAHRGE